MDIVRLLVSHSADLNATDHSGATPRDLALECDFYDCADLIDELKGTVTVDGALSTGTGNLQCTMRVDFVHDISATLGLSVTERMWREGDVACGVRVQFSLGLGVH